MPRRRTEMNRLRGVFLRVSVALFSASPWRDNARMRFALLLVGLLLAPGQAPAPAPTAAKGPDPSQYETDIHAFEVEDMSDPPPKGGIIFTGSSSIRMWTTLREDFAGLPVLNRGFGGSMIPEVTAFLDRIIVPH